MVYNGARLEDFVSKVREKRNLIVRENYWLCNPETVFKVMNSRKDLNSVLSSSSR